MKLYIFLIILLLALLTACGQAPASAPTLDSLKGRIVFVSRKSGNPEIYAMDANGQNLKQLTNSTFVKYQPKWSPDGERIIFVSSNQSGELGIYAMNADGSNLTLLSTKLYKFIVAPEWSPDGKKIVFATLTNLVTLDLQTGTHTEFAPDIKASSISWAPDGKKLVFIGQVGLKQLNDGIYSINNDGTNQTALTEDNANGMLFNISWSPDGKRIAFGTTSFSKNDTKTKDSSRLRTTFTMRPDGSDVQQITDQCTSGSWSPDSQWIVCASRDDESGSSGLYVINAANGTFFRLTNTPYAEYDPDWSPNP